MVVRVRIHAGCYGRADSGSFGVAFGTLGADATAAAEEDEVAIRS